MIIFIVTNLYETDACKGRTIRKLMGGGRGGGRSTKKKFAQGKIKRKKILARQLTIKNIRAMA